MIVVSCLAFSKMARAYKMALPCEACGLVLGWAEGLAWYAADVALPKGNAGSLDGFELSDREIFRIAAFAADRGLSIVAVFHTHPSSGFAGLSEADMAAIRYSQWPWLVVTRCRSDTLQIAAFASGSAERIDIRLAPFETLEWPEPDAFSRSCSTALGR